MVLSAVLLLSCTAIAAGAQVPLTYAQMGDVHMEVSEFETLIDELAEVAENGYWPDLRKFDPEDYMYIPHFFTNPMYILSYVYAESAAFQLYRMELKQEGAGLRCYLDNLDNEESYLVAFMESAGLESPFSPGQLETVAEFCTQLLDTLDKAAAA